MAPNLTIRESAKFISDHAIDVKINFGQIQKKAKEIRERIATLGFSINSWKQHPLNPQVADNEAIRWIFVVDLLNFSFWSSKVEGLKEFTVNGYTGYWSLCAAINRSKDKVLDVEWMINHSVEDLKIVFEPDEHSQGIPMLNERHELIKKAGLILKSKCGGEFLNLIKQAEGSAAKLLDLIINTFGNLFLDAVEYKGVLVSFHKRAQILIGDLWGCFEGKGMGFFSDIEVITMFADYRVPQTLLYFGLVEYSDRLLKTLRDYQAHHDLAKTDSLMDKNNFLIPRGHDYEVEIRGCSIHCVELLVAELQAISQTDTLPVNSIIVDFFLWDLAKAEKNSMAHLPIHRTRLIYY